MQLNIDMIYYPVVIRYFGRFSSYELQFSSICLYNEEKNECKVVNAPPFLLYDEDLIELGKTYFYDYPSNRLSEHDVKFKPKFFQNDKHIYTLASAPFCIKTKKCELDRDKRYDFGSTAEFKTIGEYSVNVLKSKEMYKYLIGKD